MRDDTHYSGDGRGVDLTGLFEGLASSCIEACLSMNDIGFLYDIAYEYFVNVGITGIFLGLLEPYLFDERIQEVPPHIIQALIGMHENRFEYDKAEAVIWHVEPTALDINQAVRLCEAHGLWDALIHVFTRAMEDYVAPIVKLIRLVREIDLHLINQPSFVNGETERNHDILAPSAYKLFPYLEDVLSGISYPTGKQLSEDEGIRARSQVYGFIFSGKPAIWPDGSDGEVVPASDVPDAAERPYPYLDLLLHFDTEAFLHAMDIAFEDPYLNEARDAISRQSIVNIMLDVMDTTDFPSSDITFLHIFVARNMPKYPQFLRISPSALHGILVSLAEDCDQSTREDRQLAAEYLLSAYTPHDQGAMLALFDKAGFFRILRSAYSKDHRFGRLISAFLRDPEAGQKVFSNLDETIQVSTNTAGGSADVLRTITEALPQLFALSIRQTALLLDKNLPSLHTAALKSLSAFDHKQMAYLRCLLDPSANDQDEAGPLPLLRSPSTKVGISDRHRYVKLLSRHDPETVISFLDVREPSYFDLPLLVDEFESIGFFEGQLWALDRQGKTKDTFDTVSDIVRLQSADLGQALVSNDAGHVHLTLTTLQTVSRMAVRLCREHSAGRTEHAENMWFGVLHEIVELVHMVAAVTQTAEEGVQGDLQATVVNSVRSLVQETLQSLVSSSSQSLSFPRLFKRLVEASNSTTKAEKGRAYSEFRAILTGMLDSYRAEGDMLSMTTRLVEADLFEAVQEVTEKRQRGWRPATAACEVCGKVLSMTDGEDTMIGAPAFFVIGSRRILHMTCKEEEEVAAKGSQAVPANDARIR